VAEEALLGRRFPTESGAESTGLRRSLQSHLRPSKRTRPTTAAHPARPLNSGASNAAGGQGQDEPPADLRSSSAPHDTLPAGAPAPAVAALARGRRHSEAAAEALAVQASWEQRWNHLARATGIAPDEPLLLALSGGADSVLLLHLLAAARPRPELRVVHVHHGLRGAESDADQDFCQRLCASLGVPFVARRVALDPEKPGLEARARQARYHLLCAEARASGQAVILTGHHQDDVLETLLLRWIRGTHLAGLAGPRPRVVIPVGRGFDSGRPEGSDHSPLVLARPLVGLRREEVRRILSDRGLSWREDQSNQSARFTRNRVRHALLPTVREVCGAEGVENLRHFASAVSRLEGRLAGQTAHLSWRPQKHATAQPLENSGRQGGCLPRAALMRLPSALQRRALWRLLTEGTGQAPGRSLLALVLEDLQRGRCTRHTLPRCWTLTLRSGELQLCPPPRSAQSEGVWALAQGPHTHQLPLPFPSDRAPLRPSGSCDLSLFGLEERPRLKLSVPGLVTLPDGRRLGAEFVVREPGARPPTGNLVVELDAAQLGDQLEVHFPQAGDRFRGLGAPGSKQLGRFLADAGEPREERAAVPHICADNEILWVAGVRPGERHRVRSGTGLRLRLSLLQEAWMEDPGEASRDPATPSGTTLHQSAGPDAVRAPA